MYASARNVASIEGLARGGLRAARARRHRRRVETRCGRDDRGARRLSSRRSSTTRATASRVRSSPSRPTACSVSSRRTSSARWSCAASSCRACAASDAAASSTSARWAASSPFPAPLRTTRRSTRSRRSPTHCASRWPGSGSRSSSSSRAIIRTEFSADRRRRARRDIARRRAVRRLRRVRRGGDRERLRAWPARAPGRRARPSRTRDREGAERRQPAPALPGHPVRAD